MVSVSELGYLRKKEVELCGAQQKVFDNWQVGRIKYAVLTQRFDTTLLSYPYLIVESVR